MDEPASEGRKRPLLWPGLILGALAAVAIIVARWWRRRPVEQPPTRPEVPPGLTEDEAAARWSEGQDNTLHLKPPRTRQDVWRENLFTIFNLSLVGLAVTQLLLQQWLNALLSLGTIALNVGLNVGQEMLALRRLAEFQRSARPKATVVREGKTRSIDPNRVVPGDVLIVGPGDQFLVDGQAVGTGQMVVDSSLATGERGWHPVGAGDAVYAGSFCISGRGGYVAQKVGDERLIVHRLAQTPALAAELTPLEQTVDRILRGLLVVVAVFAGLLLAAYFRLDLGIPVDLFSNAASVIFNIAPSGLFLMIIVTYTKGTADLARLGALVHRARSVESLAQAAVICFAKAGILAGTRMELEPIKHADDAEPVPESRLRQILGDYARSTSAPNPVTRTLTNSFEGNRRAVHKESPFLAAYGWSAIAFDEHDLPGVYVLGEPTILEGHLVASAREVRAVESRSRATAARRPSPLGRLFRRGDKEPTAETVEDAPLEVAVATADAGGNEEIPEESEGRQPFLRRWVGRVRGTLRRTERAPERAEEKAEATAVQEATLLFAYHPGPVPLRDDEGNIQLPQELIPLCELHYAQEFRSEAVEIVRGFARTGVSIKVFASDEPAETLGMLQEAGLRMEDEERLPEVRTISGRDLKQTPPAEWTRTAIDNSIFGDITPAQAGALVQALRESGESVAVVGDSVTDLPALREANLAIARQTSTQAALGVADIVMMANSPSALLQVLYRGQAIVHGLLDVLKLNLTQVFYLALLIVAIQLVSFGFPYVAIQGTVIAIITVTLPSIGLSLWARPGVVSSPHLGRHLARFVAPAALSLSLTALLVYLHFLDRTGRVAYAQLAVTYTLIYAGLLLAVLIKPPWRSPKGGRDSAYGREWRMVGLALFLGIAAFFLPAIPAARRHLMMDWLQQPADYGIVALAVVSWAVILSLVWWILPPVERFIRNLAPEEKTRRRRGSARATERQAV